MSLSGSNDLPWKSVAEPRREPLTTLGQRQDREDLLHRRARGVQRALRARDVGDDQVEQPTAERVRGPSPERMQRRRREAG